MRMAYNRTVDHPASNFNILVPHPIRCISLGRLCRTQVERGQPTWDCASCARVRVRVSITMASDLLELMDSGPNSNLDIEQTSAQRVHYHLKLVQAVPLPLGTAKLTF